MKALKASTWVLIGLGLLAVGLGTTLYFVRPPGLPFGYGHGIGMDRAISPELSEKFAGKKFSELTAEEREQLRREQWGDRFSAGRPFAGRPFAGRPFAGRGAERESFAGREFVGRGHAGAHSFVGTHHVGFPLIGLILVAGTAVVVVVLVRKRRSARTSRPDSSLEILEEQFAEGKIDEQEFARKRAVLRNEGKGEQS